MVPVAFQSHDKSLKPTELQYAVELGQKFPTIIAASEDFKAGYNAAGLALSAASEKWRGMVIAIHGAKLNRREASILMRGLGFIKSRVSEVLRVVESDESVFQRYIKGEMGFKAVLAIEQAKTAEQKVAKVQKPRKSNVIRSVSELIGKKLNLVASGWRVSEETTQEFAYACVKNGKRYYFAISIGPDSTGNVAGEGDEGDSSTGGTPAE